MKKSRLRFDILSIKPMRTIIASPVFPVVLQVFVVAVVLAVAYFGLGVGEGLDDSSIDILRKTNLSSLLVWGIWWPAMIALVLFFGRVWCTVCPMELVNRVADSVARKIGWRRVRLGKFLRAGWMVIAAYLVMQILVEVGDANHIPNRTALLLFGLVGFAFLTGLIFRHPRSFCQSFCPAGALLSVYGRYTPLQLDISKDSVCDECVTKDCIREKNRYRFDKRSCPSLLQPYKREASDGCVLCFQCSKVCPYDNMGWGIVKAGAQVRRKSMLKPFEAVFIMVALGSVFHETAEEVPWFISIFDHVPESLASMAPSWEGVFVFLWYIIVLPAVFWMLVSLLALLFGQKASMGRVMIGAATGAAPVVAIAHFAKASYKIFSFGGYLPAALSDPSGMETAHKILNGSVGSPAALVGLSVVGWIMLAATLFMAWLSLRWMRDLPDEIITVARTAMAGALVLFSSLLVIWGLSG